MPFRIIGKSNEDEWEGNARQRARCALNSSWPLQALENNSRIVPDGLWLRYVTIKRKSIDPKKRRREFKLEQTNEDAIMTTKAKRKTS